MRFTIAKLAIGLAMLGWGACGRTDLDLPQAGYAGAGADESEGSGAGEGGAVSSSRTSGFAGAGGSSPANTMPPKGGSSSPTSWTGGSPVLGGLAIGGRSVVGGSAMTSGAAGRSMVGGSSSGAAGRSGGAGASSVGGSYRSAGAIAGISAVGGAAVAGRNGGSGGSAGGGGASSSARGGINLSSRSGGSVVSSGGTSTSTTLASNEELIDDLNDGDRFLVKAGGRVGAWKTSDDGTSGGSMVPDPNTTFVSTDTGDPNWKYAVYVKGSGFTSQGSSVSLGLGAPYDASKYTGISFWAKSDAGSTYARVQFPDKDTDLDAGLCTMSGPASTMCYDHYGYRFQFAPGWNKYIIPFKNLSQDGWGRKGTAFDPSTLFEIIFLFPANSSYAVWIDNLAFTL
jgi:hypothetical protein